jgi:DNA integrity scanning protein DisA with diadenylate cyclase activity
VKFNEEFFAIFHSAATLAKTVGADAVVLLIEGAIDWERLPATSDELKIVIVADDESQVEDRPPTVSVLVVGLGEAPVFDKLSQALLKGVAEEHLAPGSRVVAVYNAFEPRTMDSISVIDLSDHLGRLTVRDLRQLETRVPLDTLQTVVNLALEIGREGREGKPVGTLFVVGDSVRVRKMCRSAGFDPVRGYSRKERNLKSSRVREAIKEIAQMDGAIVVAPDGTVEAASQYLDAPAHDVTLGKGLGARHWAAASITRATKAVSVAVSESSGTVRIFQNGEVVLRIEPLRRPVTWKGFSHEAPERID